jgi:hypothetical protein
MQEELPTAYGEHCDHYDGAAATNLSSLCIIVVSW